MGLLGNILNAITGSDERDRRRRAERKFYRNRSIQAAQQGLPLPGWRGIQSYKDEDRANKDYLTSLNLVLQRSQDLDANNPDIHGFHRTRTAQVVGPGVRFRSSARSAEVGVGTDALTQIRSKIDRCRELHSASGGFDATGNNRPEGEMQERSFLTALIHGCCLIHKVWRPENRMLPLSLELIPGVRISTPIDKSGDPRISYGIQYVDTHRSRVEGYWVRRVSKTIGDSFVSDFTWDFLPAEDCSLMSLVEAAGMDRAMPVSLSCVRMVHNRGEFIEATVSAARAQSTVYAQVECAPGADPWATAADDVDQTIEQSAGKPLGFQQMGSVNVIYGPNGEKWNWNSAKLPGPDFVGFMSETDSRMARGMASSKSIFTRSVQSSWAAGRMEAQQDDPLISQYRRSFVSSWNRVNQWFMEAVWMSGAVDVPNYSPETAIYWNQFHAEFPGKAHINPVDEMTAREKGFLTRTLTPQQACEQDGRSLDENLDQWGEAMSKAKKAAAKYGLEAGALDFCVSGKAISTASGEDIQPEVATENDDGAPPPQPTPRKKKPDPSAFMNRFSEELV